MNAELIKFARQLHGWGANVTAIQRGTKQPAHKWQHWQHTRQPSDELERLPWDRAAAVGIVNGSGAFRVFDIDAPKSSDGRPLVYVPISVVHTALRAIGVPVDYQWAYISGSGAGFGFVIRCDEDLPESWDAQKGVYQGQPRNGFEFDHLELRWSSGQTVIMGDHPIGSGYRWLRTEPPFLPPKMITAESVIASFESIAEISQTRPENAPAPPAGTSAYGHGALADAMRHVSSAANGTRNDTLFKQTAALVELVKGGELAEHEVERSMIDAGLVAGLTEQEVKATLKSAFNRETIARTAPTRYAADRSPSRKGHAETPDAVGEVVDFRRYQPEDGGILDAWLETHGGDWMYVDGLADWFHWSGTHWQQNATAHSLKNELMLLMQQLNAAALEARRSATGDDRKALTAYVNATKRTAARVSSIEQMAQVRCRVTIQQINRLEALNLENGTLDLHTSSFRPHAREDRLTYCLPYGYDPAAEAPIWNQVVGRLEPETAAFLQEFAGYTLTTDTQHEIALWLYGPPGGGKSTFLTGLQAMVGPQATTLGLADILNNRFALAQLPGKTLAIATEQPSDYLATTHTLNALISGESIIVDRKFRDAIEVKPVAKLAWAMNDLPRLKGGNDGLFRRVKIVNFPALPVSERQTGFKDALTQETPGILNWALEGLGRMRKRGYFDIPMEVVNATTTFSEQNDVPALFLAERCERDPLAEIGGQALYDTYKQWCLDTGHKSQSTSTVARDWERLGLVRQRNRIGSIWQGAKLR